MNYTDFNDLVERREPFDPVTTGEQEEVNDLLREERKLEENSSPQTMRKLLQIPKRIRLSYLSAVYGGKDPKTIDKKILWEIAESGFDSTMDDVERKYKRRIKSPLTGVRSFCVVCQGGSVGLIKDCTTTNCPLWGFRFGKNPFWNRLPDTNIEEVEIDDSDLEVYEDGNTTPINE